MAPITAFFQQAGQARAKATPVLIVLDDAAQTPSVKPSKPPAVGQDAATLISPADDRVCQVSPEARAQAVEAHAELGKRKREMSEEAERRLQEALVRDPMLASTDVSALAQDLQLSPEMLNRILTSRRQANAARQTPFTATKICSGSADAAPLAMGSLSPGSAEKERSMSAIEPSVPQPAQQGPKEAGEDAAAGQADDPPAKKAKPSAADNEAPAPGPAPAAAAPLDKQALVTGCAKQAAELRRALTRMWVLSQPADGEQLSLGQAVKAALLIEGQAISLSQLSANLAGVLDQGGSKGVDGAADGAAADADTSASSYMESVKAMITSLAERKSYGSKDLKLGPLHALEHSGMLEEADEDSGVPDLPHFQRWTWELREVKQLPLAQKKQAEAYRRCRRALHERALAAYAVADLASKSLAADAAAAASGKAGAANAAKAAEARLVRAVAKLDKLPATAATLEVLQAAERGEIKRKQRGGGSGGAASEPKPAKAAKTGGQATPGAAAVAVAKAAAGATGADASASQQPAAACDAASPAAVDGSQAGKAPGGRAAATGVDKEQARLEREAERAKREADKVAAKEAERLAKEAERMAKEAAKEAERLAKEAAKEAERLAKEAAKEAERVAKEAAKEAERAAKEAERVAKEAAKERAKQEKEAERVRKVEEAAERKKVEEAKKLGFANADALKKSQNKMKAFFKVKEPSEAKHGGSEQGSAAASPGKAGGSSPGAKQQQQQLAAAPAEKQPLFRVFCTPPSRCTDPGVAAQAQQLDADALAPYLQGSGSGSSGGGKGGGAAEPALGEAALAAARAELLRKWAALRGQRRRLRGVPPTWARKPACITAFAALAARYYGDAFDLASVRTWRRKLLAPDAGSVRPPYYGSFSRSSTAVRPRQPWGKDPTLDYEVASDEDWEEEPEGESLSDDGDDDKEEKAEGEESEDDGFMVKDGYLSDDEGVRGSQQEEIGDGPDDGADEAASPAAAAGGAAGGVTAGGKGGSHGVQVVDPRIQLLEASLERARRANRPLILSRMPGLAWEPTSSTDPELLRALRGMVLRPAGFAIWPPADAELYTQTAAPPEAVAAAAAVAKAVDAGAAGSAGEDATAAAAAAAACGLTGGPPAAAGSMHAGRPKTEVAAEAVPLLLQFLASTPIRSLDKATQAFMDATPGFKLTKVAVQRKVKELGYAWSNGAWRQVKEAPSRAAALAAAVSAPDAAAAAPAAMAAPATVVLAAPSVQPLMPVGKPEAAALPSADAEAAAAATATAAASPASAAKQPASGSASAAVHKFFQRRGTSASASPAALAAAAKPKATGPAPLQQEAAQAMPSLPPAADKAAPAAAAAADVAEPMQIDLTHSAGDQEAAAAADCGTAAAALEDAPASPQQPTPTTPQKQAVAAPVEPPAAPQAATTEPQEQAPLPPAPVPLPLIPADLSALTSGHPYWQELLLWVAKVHRPSLGDVKEAFSLFKERLLPRCIHAVPQQVLTALTKVLGCTRTNGVLRAAAARVLSGIVCCLEGSMRQQGAGSSADPAAAQQAAAQAASVSAPLAASLEELFADSQLLLNLAEALDCGNAEVAKNTARLLGALTKVGLVPLQPREGDGGASDAAAAAAAGAELLPPPVRQAATAFRSAVTADKEVRKLLRSLIKADNHTVALYPLMAVHSLLLDPASAQALLSNQKLTLGWMQAFAADADGHHTRLGVIKYKLQSLVAIVRSPSLCEHWLGGAGEEQAASVLIRMTGPAAARSAATEAVVTLLLTVMERCDGSDVAAGADTAASPSSRELQRNCLLYALEVGEAAAAALGRSRAPSLASLGAQLAQKLQELTTHEDEALQGAACRALDAMVAAGCTQAGGSGMQ